MKLFTFFIFVMVSLLAYILGRRDGETAYAEANERIQDIMSGVDITQFANEEEIQKYIAEKMGMRPEDIFVERVIIDSDNENK